MITVLGPVPDLAAASYVDRILFLFSSICLCRSLMTFSCASPNSMTIGLEDDGGGEAGDADLTGETKGECEGQSGASSRIHRSLVTLRNDGNASR